jgi:2-phospho-L-lactate/phosphoenolpyruvate guanylyltransferase
MTPVCAVIPMKHTTHSKQRLAAILTAPQRRHLALAMFTDVLAALRATRGLTSIAVVTTDPDVTRIAQHAGARIITQGATEGHTAAVTAAAAILAAEHQTMLALPGDIPLVTPAEIETLLAAHHPAPCAGLVPAHDRRGTNAVLLSPPDILPLRFGNDSFAPHLALAQARNIPTHCHDLPGIALDIDTPADLHAFRPLGAHTHTGRQLTEWTKEELFFF